MAQAGAGLPGGRRPQDQHLPGRRPPRRGLRGLLLPRRAGAGPGQTLQVHALAPALRAAQRHRITDSRRALRGRPLLGRRRRTDHGRPHPRAAPGRRDDGPARRRDRTVPAHRAGDGDGRPAELPRPARPPAGELELALLPGQSAADEQAPRVRDQQQPARRVADPARAAGPGRPRRQPGRGVLLPAGDPRRRVLRRLPQRLPRRGQHDGRAAPVQPQRLRLDARGARPHLPGPEPRLLGPVHGRGRSLGDPGRRRDPHLLRRRRLPPRLVPVRRARGPGHARRAGRQQDGAGAGDAAARRVLLARLHRAAGAVRDPPVHQPRLRADRQRPLRTQGLPGGRACGRRGPRRARLRTRRLPAVPR